MSRYRWKIASRTDSQILGKRRHWPSILLRNRKPMPRPAPVSATPENLLSPTAINHKNREYVTKPPDMATYFLAIKKYSRQYIFRPKSACQLVFQQFIHLRRVALAPGRFHHLTDQRIERLVLAGAEFLD